MVAEQVLMNTLLRLGLAIGKGRGDCGCKVAQEIRLDDKVLGYVTFLMISAIQYLKLVEGLRTILTSVACCPKSSYFHPFSSHDTLTRC